LRRQAGFTLIEVMLALAIMGVAVVTLLLIQTEAIRMGGDANSLRNLTLLAAEKTQELAQSPQEDASGNFGAPYEAYRYTVATSDETWKTPSSDDAGTDPGMVEELELKKRTLTVTAPDGQLKVVIVSYSFPQDEASKEQPEGGGEEGGG